MNWSNHQSQLFQHKAFKDFEHKRLDDKGVAVSLSASGKPVFNADNIFTGYQDICRTITERKRTEKALTES